MTRLTIGKFARETGVNIETIRYFEKVGLLMKPERTEGGHRIYRDQDVRTLKFIKRARQLGFNPKEVRALIKVGGPTEACCDEVQEIAAYQLDQVRRKIADLSRLEVLLTSAIEKCSGGHVRHCAIIDMLEGPLR